MAEKLPATNENPETTPSIQGDTGGRLGVPEVADVAQVLVEPGVLAVEVQVEITWLLESP